MFPFFFTRLKSPFTKSHSPQSVRQIGPNSKKQNKTVKKDYQAHTHTLSLSLEQVLPFATTYSATHWGVIPIAYHVQLSLPPNSSRVYKCNRTSKRLPLAAPCNGTADQSDTQFRIDALKPDYPTTFSVFHIPRVQQSCKNLKHKMEQQHYSTQPYSSFPGFFSSFCDPPLCYPKRTKGFEEIFVQNWAYTGHSAEETRRHSFSPVRRNSRALNRMWHWMV